MVKPDFKDRSTWPRPLLRARPPSYCSCTSDSLGAAPRNCSSPWAWPLQAYWHPSFQWESGKNGAGFLLPGGGWMQTGPVVGSHALLCVSSQVCVTCSLGVCYLFSGCVHAHGLWGGERVKTEPWENRYCSWIRTRSYSQYFRHGEFSAGVLVTKIMEGLGPKGGKGPQNIVNALKVASCGCWAGAVRSQSSPCPTTWPCFRCTRC